MQGDWYGSIIPGTFNWHLNLCSIFDLEIPMDNTLKYSGSHDFSTLMRLTLWFRHSCMTWSPEQPVQMRCGMTMGISIVTLKVSSPFVSTIFWKLSRQFRFSNTQILFRILFCILFSRRLHKWYFPSQTHRHVDTCNGCSYLKFTLLNFIASLLRKKWKYFAGLVLLFENFWLCNYELFENFWLCNHSYTDPILKIAF